jgi:membrane-associated protease RseP (regulator of RpoE activity)
VPFRVIEILILAVALVGAVHPAGVIAAALLLRVQIKTVSYGLGPVLASFRLGRVTVDLRPVPLAAWVKFAEPDDVPPGVRSFRQIHLVPKIAIALSGCATCLIASCAVLGPSAAMSAAAASWGEFFGVMTAFPDLAAPWKPVVEAVRAQTFVMTFGLACAKIGGLNLLPLALLNAGSVVMYLLEPGSGGAPPGRVADLYFKVSAVVFFLLLLLWLIGAAMLVVRGG